MEKQEYKPATDAELTEEARRWDSGIIRPGEWVTDPEAIPRYGESTAISLRLPTRMLDILKEFAKRKNIGYQVLLKNWLDDRIRLEREKLVQKVAEPEPEYNAGKGTVRLPETLRNKLVQAAASKGVSLDAYVAEILSAVTTTRDARIDALIVEVRELRESLISKEVVKADNKPSQ